MNNTKLFFILCVFCLQISYAADVPLRADLAGYSYKITTTSADAQKYFDQGLVLLYGFNYPAAMYYFKRATELDPACAMCWWGVAASAGPHINYPFMDSTAARIAAESAQKAAQHAVNATAVEKDLTTAINARYVFPLPEDRRSLDSAYADAMRFVWAKHPNDADVGALFADAMLNLRPWDQWTAAGEPQPGTPEIMATLESVMKFAPDHPGACHLYIHTMESSPTPEKALTAANVLRTRIPGVAHLVHMPAHIDMRLGHYDNAIAANVKAVSVDSTWDLQGTYAFYRAHDYHFLAWAAMYTGRRELAMKAARDMVSVTPPSVVREIPDFIEGFLPLPTHVMVRFGMWDELLKEPQPPADEPLTTAFWRYGRTIAFAALGKVAEGEAELAEFRKAAALVPETRYIGNNTGKLVLELAMPVAEGELEYRKKNYDRAFALLREAVRKDDSLRYDEPWGWMMPARHPLGALLLEQNMLEEAEQVYRADLARHPGNGWALKGLAECMAKSGNKEEAAKLEEQFRAAWKLSDTPIKASCFCARGKS